MLDIIKDYTKKRLDLLKMEATEKGVATAGTVTIGVLLGVFGIFFLILLNIGIGLLIGYYLNNYGYGVLIVAGFYLLLIIIVILARKAVKNLVANKIIKAIYKQDE